MSDKYFNALRVKFGYAITCHKAQGGEWKRAFVNCKTSMGYFNLSYFRWLYTALTRAKKTLYTLNEPHLSPVSTLKRSQNQNPIPKQNTIVVKPEILETNFSFDGLPNQTLLQSIFYAVHNQVKNEDINISRIEHYQYCEHYTFSKNKDITQLKLYYNKKNQISRIEKPSNTELAQIIYQKLEFLINKTIVFEGEQENENEDLSPRISFDEPFLQDFYELIVSKISPHNIRVIEVKQYPWLQRYTFKKGNTTTELDFYYNVKKQFTRVVPQTEKSNSAELLNEVLSLIEDLK